MDGLRRVVSRLDFQRNALEGRLSWQGLCRTEEKVAGAGASLSPSHLLCVNCLKHTP